MILRDKGKLDIAYVPAEAPCREREKQRLATLLRGGHALICGDIGTGKTLLAKQMGPTVYVNCYSHKSEYKILEEILRQLRPTFSTAGLTPQRLWREIQGDPLIVLDEMDGIVPEDLPHFAYTLSRQPEIAQRIRYIGITRSSVSLKTLIGDPATWSTFGEKCCVELEPYTLNEMIKILEYRSTESFHPGTCPDDLLTMIAHIAQVSEGHMRAGIDVLRNSALVAETKDHDILEPEDVREANQEGWVSDITTLTAPQMFVLLSVAYTCRKKAFVTYDEIHEMYQVTCENWNVEIKKGDLQRHLQDLVTQNFVYRDENRKNGRESYMILDYPTGILISTLEETLKGV